MAEVNGKLSASQPHFTGTMAQLRVEVRFHQLAQDDRSAETPDMRELRRRVRLFARRYRGMLVCKRKLSPAVAVTAGERKIQRLSLPAMFTQAREALAHSESGGELTPLLARPNF
jgi:hypothetical protein